jgi:hypothetical protein
MTDYSDQLDQNKEVFSRHINLGGEAKSTFRIY